jgi:hypothetical protein
MQPNTDNTDNNGNTDHNDHNDNNGNHHKGRVLRFEFSSAIIELMKAFTEVHQYDDRKTYKEAWTAWLLTEDAAALLKTEVERLTDLGYKGDVADKLFKSGRYYFRQKTCGPGNYVPRTPPPNLSLHADPMCPKQVGVRDVPIALVAPRKYVLLNRDLLNVMDTHIECGLRFAEYTPAGGFAEFCKLNVDSYRDEVARLSELMTTGEAVHDKLKKTYKNRYFMIVKMHN